MKYLSVIIVLLLAATSVNAQVDPVEWTFSAERVGNDTYDIVLEGTISPGWYLYSQFLTEDDGPIPTTVYLEPQVGAFELVGIVSEEGGRKEAFDPVFEMNLVKFGKTVKFTQQIKLRGDGTPQISGHIEYMTCNDDSCLPPKEVPFSLELDRS
jgi:DsbC/DsbD-like thiol-disulfide interchange protein